MGTITNRLSNNLAHHLDRRGLAIGSKIGIDKRLILCIIMITSV